MHLWERHMFDALNCPPESTAKIKSVIPNGSGLLAHAMTAASSERDWPALPPSTRLSV